MTLQYFGDLECPICKAFTLARLPTLIPKYVRTGQVEDRIPLDGDRHPRTETFRTQQVAALAAGKQNLAWYYLELFYREQGEEDSGYVTESYLQGLAQQVPGLNLPNWSAARNDPALAEQITRDEQTVTQEGFTGTPSFLLGKSGGALQQFKPETFTEAGVVRSGDREAVDLSESEPRHARAPGTAIGRGGGAPPRSAPGAYPSARTAQAPTGRSPEHEEPHGSPV